MQIFFSVGEPSGDLHASNLIESLREHNPAVRCIGFGGPRMAEAGCRLLYDMTPLAVMFLTGIFSRLPTFFRLLRQADEVFAGGQIDAVVLIDYPGFNWWVARRAKRHGIPVIYYGVPQMWAWAPWRVHKLRRLVSLVLCKLPFERKWFEDRGCQAIYVGHPYFDELHSRKLDESFCADYGSGTARLLTLLPGSRDQELRANLESLLKAAEIVQQQNNDVAVAIACYSQAHRQAVLQRVNELRLPFDVFTGRTPELIALADVCLACSGSVSLELMHHRVPSVIVYRIGHIKFLLQSLVLRTRYITLVNLLAADSIERYSRQPYDPDAEHSSPAVMPEYLVTNDPAESMARHAQKWLQDEPARQRTIGQLDQLAQQYGQAGASQRAAEMILQFLSDHQPTSSNQSFSRPAPSDSSEQDCSATAAGGDQWRAA